MNSNSNSNSNSNINGSAAGTQPEQTITEIVMPGLIEPSGLVVRQSPRPAPAAGEVLLRMEATGVSFAEKSMRRGRYPGQPTFPFVPGYDVVGTVVAVGPGVATQLIGTRAAAALKTGGWASELSVPARKLVPVADGMDAAQVETVIVNGITAWQMLHRSARVKSGQTILVHGASSGVGVILAQLAVHSGIRVIGTAAPRNHQVLRDLGVEPVDYTAPDLEARLRQLAPGGVDAAFDHLGLDSARLSFGLLAPKGSLVSYGFASGLDEDSSVVGIFIKMLSQITAWNLFPNTRRASFYNFWGGSAVRSSAFQRRMRTDLTHVLGLLAEGAIVPQVAATFPLREAAAALELAESRTAMGKVVIVP
jgi:NADPH:quinone reductase-like Zn-dependent oxidoreductase